MESIEEYGRFSENPESTAAAGSLKTGATWQTLNKRIDNGQLTFYHLLMLHVFGIQGVGTRFQGGSYNDGVKELELVSIGQLCCKRGSVFRDGYNLTELAQICPKIKTFFSRHGRIF